MGPMGVILVPMPMLMLDIAYFILVPGLNAQVKRGHVGMEKLSPMYVVPPPCWTCLVADG